MRRVTTTHTAGSCMGGDTAEVEVASDISGSAEAEESNGKGVLAAVGVETGEEEEDEDGVRRNILIQSMTFRNKK